MTELIGKIEKQGLKKDYEASKALFTPVEIIHSSATMIPVKIFTL